MNRMYLLAAILGLMGTDGPSTVPAQSLSVNSGFWRCFTPGRSHRRRGRR